MIAGSRGLRAMAWGWLLLGGLLSAAGALMLLAAGLFVANSTVAVGEVVDHERRGSGHRRLQGGADSELRVAVVEYRDGGGRLRRIIGNVALDAPRVPAVGSRVPVRHQTLADGSVVERIDRGAEIWTLPVLLALFGAGFLGAGVIGRRAAARGAGLDQGPLLPRGLYRDPSAAARIMAKLRRRRR